MFAILDVYQLKTKTRETIGYKLSNLGWKKNVLLCWLDSRMEKLTKHNFCKSYQLHSRLVFLSNWV